jgi:hypothetical protein
MGLIAACSTRRNAGAALGRLAGRRARGIPAVDHSTALIVKGQGEAVAALKIVADLGFVLSSATSCFALAALFLRFAARRGRYWIACRNMPMASISSTTCS